MAPLRILVADDNRDAATTLGNLLSYCCHQVRLANNGREALEVAKDWEPDVVVLDLEMPEMNGFAAAQAIRRETTVPVLAALSGRSGPEVEGRVKDAGFDLFFCKGVSFQNLAAALEDIAGEKLDAADHAAAATRPRPSEVRAGGVRHP
jgi:CheY-like chemotaxis protein